MSQRPRSEPEILLSLERLAHQPGFVYVLALVAIQDLFFVAEAAAEINWAARLSFQELTVLAGLMAKNPIEVSIAPSEQACSDRIAELYALFSELHEAHTLPMVDALGSQMESRRGAREVDEQTESIFADGRAMVEPIFYSGSGGYDFQYLDFAITKYEQDADWMVTNAGISVVSLARVARELKQSATFNVQAYRKAISHADKCRTALATFSFVRGDLAFLTDHEFASLIRLFSITPGNVEYAPSAVGASNDVEFKPILLLGADICFIPIIFNLAKSIYESPYYWMGGDRLYRNRAFRHRGEAAEVIAARLLAPVFGEQNVYQNVLVKDGRRTVTDIDVLAIAGNRAVVVQAKSKRLTELAKTGNDERVRSDFSKAIQEAYGQGLLCRDALLARENSFTDNSGQAIQLPEDIEDAYVICLNLDSLPALTHMLETFLVKELEDPFPVALSVFDLDVIATYLTDPFEFLYYLRQRVKLTTHFHAASEMPLLAYHLNRKLYAHQDFTYEMIPEDWAQLIDANFPAVRGQAPSTPAMTRLHAQWKNHDFDRLVDLVKTAPNPRFTDALFMLYDIAGETADTLMQNMQEAQARCVRNRQPSDFSILFGDGSRGASYVCLPSAAPSLRNRLEVHVAARKYKSRADEWLGLAGLATSPWLADVVAFTSEPWVSNSELEEVSQLALRRGVSRAPGGKKMGRNARCYCGSGKKFKKCHGDPA